MKKHTLWILYFLLFSISVKAQQENVWAFGTKAGLGFNGGTPAAIQTAMMANEGGASVCDASGQLLFYTDGSNIWDRANNLMPNASSIIASHNIYGISATSSSTQGALIVPMPDSVNRYYVFSVTELEEGSYSGYLYYSVVDMTLNGGLGDIMTGRKAILIDTGFAEKLTGVVGDRCDVWVLVHAKNASQFNAYEITDAGLNLSPVVSNIGSLTSSYQVGAIMASPDRKRVVACNVPNAPTGGAELYDFDPATGILSNNVFIDNTLYYSAAFSPDGSKMYLSGPPNYVYQFDLSSGNITTIRNSKYQVGILDFGVSAGAVKLGPDGKIYCAGSSNSRYLSTINAPNLAKTACQFSVDAVSLVSGTTDYLSLPNVVPVFVRDTAINSKFIPVCFQSSYQLQADTPGWDYKWSSGSTNSALTVNASGKYYVSYHMAPCVYRVDTFVVSFASQAPSMGSFSGCRSEHNDYIWIYPAPGDTTTYTYSWYSPSGQILQTDTKAQTGDTLFDVVPGTYRVTMNGINGCDTVFSISLLAPSSLAGFSADTTGCTGAVLTFANTSTNDLVDFQWDFGDSTTSTDTNPSHTYNNPGTYTVRLIGGPCLDTAYGTVTIQPTPTVSLGDDTVLCYNAEFILVPYVQPAGYVYTYQWSPAAAVSDPATKDPFFISHSSQTLSLQVATSYNCLGSDNIIVNVDTSHFIIANTDTTICPQDTIQLHVAGGVSYQWINSQLYISDTTSATPFVSAGNPYTYTVAAKDSLGCLDSAHIRIGVYPNAVILLPDTIVLYSGESTMLSTEGNCTSFVWFPPSGLSNVHISNPVALPSVDTKYLVWGTTENGCATEDSVIVLVSNETLLALPNAFAPGNGPNAIFKIIKRGAATLNYFRVFDRWGKKVFETTNIEDGWDGSLNGTPQPTGVYVYMVEAVAADGTLFHKQGNVTLLR